MSRITVMHYPVLEVLRVIDGDTFDAHLDLGLRQYGHYRIRLRAVDTPEIYGPNASEAGRRAAEFAEQWLTEAGNLWVEIHREGTFARWIGEFIDLATSRRLSAELLEAGLARPYEKR